MAIMKFYLSVAVLLAVVVALEKAIGHQYSVWPAWANWMLVCVNSIQFIYFVCFCQVIEKKTKRDD